VFGEFLNRTVANIEEVIKVEELQETKTVSKKSPNLIVIGGVLITFILVGVGFLVNSGKLFQEAVQPQVSDNANLGQSEVAGVETAFETGTDIDSETIKIEAGSFYYNPEEIRVKVGENVKIELISKDMMHDFNIDELGVKSPVTLAGETTIIEFTPQEIGEFEYYCSVANHKAMGQVGRLVVEE
jgi:plastocyanin